MAEVVSRVAEAIPREAVQALPGAEAVATRAAILPADQVLAAIPPVDPGLAVMPRVGPADEAQAVAPRAVTERRPAIGSSPTVAMARRVGTQGLVPIVAMTRLAARIRSGTTVLTFLSTSRAASSTVRWSLS